MDFNALKDRLNQLNRKTAKSDDFWKPKDEHQVRLVQDPHSDDPFQELSFHYELGDNLPVLCPKVNFGDECAICDFADALKSFKTPDGDDKPKNEQKADWEIFKKIQAKARVFCPVVERGKEETGAKWWSMTAAQAQSALDVCMDGDRLEELGIDKDDASKMLNVIFDPKKGYDLNVSYAKPGEKGNNKTFTTITVKGRIKPTPLAKDDATIKKIVESVKKLSDVYPKVPSSEVEKVLKKFIGTSSEPAKAEGGTEKYANKKEEAKPANTKENAKVTGTRSIDDAFSDLLKDS